LDRHGLGFTASLKDWGEHLGLQAFHFICDRPSGSSVLREARDKDGDANWDLFVRMPSTREFGELIGSCAAFYQMALEASRCSRLGLRGFLLAGTGSLAQSYLHTRSCPSCFVMFDFLHFILCPCLGKDLSGYLSRFIAKEDWESFVNLLLSRFRVSITFFRPGAYDDEGSALLI
jgi:hypothetical protein